MSGPRAQHYERMEEAVLNDPMYYQHRNEQSAELRMAMRDAAALGYVQALRELREDMKEHVDYMGWSAPSRYIERFATEHGIDLDTTDDGA